MPVRVHAVFTLLANPHVAKQTDSTFQSSYLE